jgi:hypothetical protein
MRRMVVLSALSLVAGLAWSGALAQTQPGSPREAPVGHRQPTASGVPQDSGQTPAEKRQKELDEPRCASLGAIKAVPLIPQRLMRWA